MVGSNKKVVRGVHFLIPIEGAIAFEKEGETFVKNYNKIAPILLNYYKKVLTEYPTSKLLSYGIMLDTQNDFITGLDGKSYELSELVTNRKVGNKSWFKKSEQLPTDEINTSAGKKLKDTQIKDMLHSIFPEMSSSYVFDLRDYFTNRLTSRKRQATKKKPLNQVVLGMERPPLLRNNTIHSKRKRFQLKDGLVTYKNQKDKIISAAYTTSTPLDQVINSDKLFGRDIGGNCKITKKKRHSNHKFTVQCEKTQTFGYSPVSWVGMDINVEAIFWNVFYDLQTEQSFVWPRENYPQSLIDQRAAITALIDDNSKGQCNAKIRAKLRKKRDAIDKKQKQYARRIFIPLLERLKKEKKGLSIDQVSWGASSGNNGMQESISGKNSGVLMDLCVEIGVPYYCPKAYYGSRDCSKCLHRHTTAQKGKMKDTFVCKKCGHTSPIHENAARNAALRAKEQHDLI